MSGRTGVDIGKIYVSKNGMHKVKVVGYYRHVVTLEEGILFEDAHKISSGIHLRAASLQWWHQEQEFKPYIEPQAMAEARGGE